MLLPTLLWSIWGGIGAWGLHIVIFLLKIHYLLYVCCICSRKSLVLNKQMKIQLC